ncbi:MAG: 16S rRNA (guanine(527)-N(7))-methyltransferase RsmG [Candidatus Acidoferrales bacterium]
MAVPLSSREIARELAEYQVELSQPALAQLSAYLELLLRWNRRINLTGLRDPHAILRRLFGESLYLSRVVELRGWLVDIGSGAGFPGLALKLVAPGLRVTLIESRRRKCAFLKEVVRECAFSEVDVVGGRFENWLQGPGGRRKADLITTRAVIVDPRLLEQIHHRLSPSGRAVFLTTAALAGQIRGLSSAWSWEEWPVPPDKRTIALVGSLPQL